MWNITSLGHLNLSMVVVLVVIKQVYTGGGGGGAHGGGDGGACGACGSGGGGGVGGRVSITYLINHIHFIRDKMLNVVLEQRPSTLSWTTTMQDRKCAQKGSYTAARTRHGLYLSKIAHAHVGP